MQPSTGEDPLNSLIRERYAEVRVGPTDPKQLFQTGAGDSSSSTRE